MCGSENGNRNEKKSLETYDNRSMICSDSLISLICYLSASCSYCFNSVAVDTYIAVAVIYAFDFLCHSSCLVEL